MPHKEERSYKVDVGMTSENCRFIEKCMAVIHPALALRNQYRNTDLVNDAEKILMSCNMSILYIRINISSLLIIETNPSHKMYNIMRSS